MTRGSVTASALMHGALLVTLFVVRPPSPIVVPGPDVVQVSLLDASAIGAPPPAPAAPKEAPRETPAPTEEEGVKLEKPKPKAPPASPVRARKPEQEPARDAAENPSLPWAPVGNAGLKGQVAVDEKNFEFTYYLLLVRSQIAGRWAAPAGLGGRGEVRATVYFRIGRDGTIRDVRLETGSGVEYFDASATRAVTISSPLPPLPLGYPGSELGVHFGFEYAGP